MDMIEDVIQTQNGAALLLNNDGTEREVPVRDMACPDCGAIMIPQAIYCGPGLRALVIRCKGDQCTQKREEAQVRRKCEAERLEREAREKDGAFLAQYGVAPGYWGCRFDNYREHDPGILKSVRPLVNGDYQTLLLAGPTGVGKSHLAAGVLRALAEQGRTGMRFESVPMLMSRFRASYDGDDGPRELDIIREIISYPVMVLDDMGTENATPNVVSLLTTIIEERTNHPDRQTIITTNLTADRLEQQYGSRLLSRLTGASGIVVELRGPDGRKRVTI